MTMLKREDCNLRLLGAEDLEIVLAWRNSERIRANMYTDHLITLAEHRAWFERSKKQTTSVYLIFEVQNRSVGLVYFTGIDMKNGRSYWGFYLGEENLPHGCGTALGVIGIAYAFTQLNIRKLCGEAFAFNGPSIRFHKKLGFVEEGRFMKHVLKRGIYEDVVSFALFQEDWENNRQVLDEIAFSSGKALV
jgi:UDP-4-amino-4,6-dideoxy-N-acetyl-beta-L-altrosamine N-acetyltransferase